MGAGQIGLLMGLGDHTQAILDVMQPVGTLIGSAIAVVIMWQCWQRRINPILGLGMAMGAFVLLAPVIQPWYLLWAALPLAALLAAGLAGAGLATAGLVTAGLATTGFGGVGAAGFGITAGCTAPAGAIAPVAAGSGAGGGVSRL